MTDLISILINSLLMLILAVASVYRLAQLITLDNGPLFVFKRIRDFAERKAAKGGDAEYGNWESLYSGLTCPHCVGIWMALLCAIMLKWRSTPTDLFLIVFGLAGLQSMVQSWTE